MRKKWVQNKMNNQKGLNLCSKTSLVLLLLHLKEEASSAAVVVDVADAISLPERKKSLKLILVLPLFSDEDELCRLT